jgi:hypothetical protein
MERNGIQRSRSEAGSDFGIDKNLSPRLLDLGVRWHVDQDLAGSLEVADGLV